MAASIDELQRDKSRDPFANSIVNCIYSMYKIGIETGSEMRQQLAEGAAQEYLSAQQSVQRTVFWAGVGVGMMGSAVFMAVLLIISR